MKVYTHHHILDGGMDYPNQSFNSEEVVLRYVASDFNMFVNETSRFKSKQPRLEDLVVSSDRIGSGRSDVLTYYRVVFDVYCATYCCGVSLAHLTKSDSVSGVIPSLIRFHVYFTTRRIVRSKHSVLRRQSRDINEI